MPRKRRKPASAADTSKLYQGGIVSYRQDFRTPTQPVTRWWIPLLHPYLVSCSHCWGKICRWKLQWWVSLPPCLFLPPYPALGYCLILFPLHKHLVFPRQILQDLSTKADLPVFPKLVEDKRQISFELKSETYQLRARVETLETILPPHLLYNLCSLNWGKMTANFRTSSHSLMTENQSCRKNIHIRGLPFMQTFNLTVGFIVHPQLKKQKVYL